MFKKLPKWEVGKTYKSRNGDLFTVLRTDLTGKQRICCISDKKVLITLSLNGSYLDDTSCPHKWDLVELTH